MSGGSFCFPDDLAAPLRPVLDHEVFFALDDFVPGSAAEALVLGGILVAVGQGLVVPPRGIGEPLSGAVVQLPVLEAASVAPPAALWPVGARRRACEVVKLRFSSD